MSEADQVRREIEASQAAGTLTAALVDLVHQISRRRCCPAMAEDVAQSVLLGLLRYLATLDPPTSYEYITSSIVKTWQHWMRGRRVEWRWMRHEVIRQVGELPAEIRSHEMGRALRSFGRACRWKYY